MRPLVVSLALILVVSTCRSQWIDPDQYNLMLQQQEQERRRASFGLQIPTFAPSVQNANANDIALSASPKNGGFQSDDQQLKPAAPRAPLAPAPESAAAAAAPSPASVGAASLNPFDTFLPPRWRDHVIEILSRGITKFTLDMDRAIEKSQTTIPDSTLFSPVCLTTNLAMVMLASGGKTFEEVIRILGLESGIDISHHSEVVHQIFGLLLNEAQRMGKLHPNLPQSKFAFGIFVEDGYPVRSEFRDVSEKVYHSEVINVDFSHHNVEAQKIVNDWVNNRTEGKIKNMLMDAPSPATDVIITSALYFSGEWDSHFYDFATRRKPFMVNSNETIYVDMMNNGGDFPFYEDKKLGAKIIAFPYKGKDVSMYALLPTETGTEAVKNLKGKLTPEVIENLIGNMKVAPCIIGYPKMKLSSTLKLQSALEALGLKSLFDPRTADLSVLSPGRNGNAHVRPSKVVAPSATDPASLSSKVGVPSQKSPARGGFRQPIQSLHSDFFFPSSRFGAADARNNLYTYEDEANGYTVEQWDTGFRFEKTRGKRQTRPIDREFVDFLNQRKLPTFGVDELRNTAGLSNPGLYADDVIHKVEMTVNEKGTEAAAATSTTLERSGDYKRFLANRPFLFFIRQNSVKSILFWATINRPAPHYTSP